MKKSCNSCGVKFDSLINYQVGNEIYSVCRKCYTGRGKKKVVKKHSRCYRCKKKSIDFVNQHLDDLVHTFCRECYRAMAKYVNSKECLRRLDFSVAEKYYSCIRRFESQGGKCAICSDAIDFIGSHLDHNHTSGSIRGYLCQRCNAGIGFLREKYFLEAHSYIRKWE